MKSLLQNFGLHPFVAFAMVIVDIMLFGTDITGVGWFISVPIALFLAAPCILIQKYSYNDNWGTSVAKGFIVGIITAIPSPLPAVITGGSGMLGAVKLMLPKPQE